jgi:ABC-2 type transport system ATP-binding protein
MGSISTPGGPGQVSADPATVAAAVVADAAISLAAVSVRYDELVALDEVSIAVLPGTILGLIGPSGAGKTTAIKILTGSLRPSSGQARVLGQDPQHASRRIRGQIGYMPQIFALYPDLTAAENVDFVASLYGLLTFRRAKRVRQVLKLVDLWNARGRRAGKLSGGQQRRLELACALVHDPTVLFLDEPTAGLDPLLRRSLWTELHRLRERGRTILVTTQYVGEAEECDAVALISEGRLVALATPEELRRMATGGDVLEIETSAAVDPAVLAALPMVRAVDQRTGRRFFITVDEAGPASPAITTAIEEAGAAVASSREYRPSFDDVFAALVGRDRRERGAGEPGAEGPESGPGGPGERPPAGPDAGPPDGRPS